MSILNATDSWTFVLVSRIDRQESMPIPDYVCYDSLNRKNSCICHADEGDDVYETAGDNDDVHNSAGGDQNLSAIMEDDGVVSVTKEYIKILQHS